MERTNTPGADWERCVGFHGHECPGLAIGFRVAQAGLEWIEANRSRDEEIVAVVENDACGVDAVQFLTGCTFGKGNLVHFDHGKQVFTFFNRDTGAGVRFSLLPNAIRRDERDVELMTRSREGTATPADRKELARRRADAMRALRERPFEELFAVSAPQISLPEKARVQQSEACAQCGEPTMPVKMVEKDGRRLCRACAANSG